MQYWSVCRLAQGLSTGTSSYPRPTASSASPSKQTTRHETGTGLGLAICARIIAGLGGKTEVDSAVVRRTLSSQHDVVTVTSAKEALEILRAGERFDVILCDVMMPQMTGVELHQQLEREAPDVLDRMIFLTGGAFTEAAREFLERVPNFRLEKPFDQHRLRTLVNARARGGRHKA